MDVLILDSDLPVSELLQTLVSGLYRQVRFRCYDSLQEAMAAWQRYPADMVITEWDLPDGKGLELVRLVRASNPDLPLVMVSARKDRDTVVAASQHRVSAFISKPLSANTVQQRLQALLPATPVTAVDSLEAMLRRASETQLFLPSDLEPALVIALIEQADSLSAQDLALEWRAEMALTARLLDVANSSSFRRSGEPCNSLKDAIRLLGVPMALNHALAQSLDITHRLADPQLRAEAEYYLRRSRELAELAFGLARKTGAGPVQCYTAGLLHRTGELAAISVLQQFHDAGGELEDGVVDKVLEQWSGPLGNVLKVAWRLPLELRNLIGAAWMLPRGTTDRDRVLMRAAALALAGEGESDQCQRLLRRIGLANDRVNAFTVD